MLSLLAEWFNGGGPFMWAILAVLAFAVTVVVERLIFFYHTCRGRGTGMVADIARHLNGNDMEKARQAASGSAPVSVLLRTALERFGAGMNNSEIQEGIEEAAIKELPRFGERLNYLALFANIATLTGLLGTIMGLQKAFSSLGVVEASQKAAKLAQGISELMVCTAFGLMVAVPCMVAYTFLHNKQNRLTRDLEESVVKIMNYFRKKRPE